MTGAQLEVVDAELVDDDRLPAVAIDTTVQQRAPLPHEQLRELFLLSKANPLCPSGKILVLDEQTFGRSAG